MVARRKLFIACLATLFLGIVGVHSGTLPWELPLASAQGVTDPLFDTFDSLNKSWSVFIEIGMMVTFVLYPIISFLLDPQFFLDVTSGGQNNLLTIWQLSRDIMNTIFAFMLIGGAMMTVVMAKEDYLKKYALKFIVGVILVNFSWFFPRVILDISNVLTANIYQIPNIVGTQCRYQERDGTFRNCEFPTDFKFFNEAERLVDNQGTLPGQNGYKCPTSFFCYRPEELDNTTNTAGGVMAGLIFNHARIGDMNKVLAERGAAADDSASRFQVMLSHIIHIGFQLLLVLYVTIILVAMAVALLVRIPILWMTMAFMPLMFLGFVVGDILPEKMNTMNLIFKKFVHAAFLPVAMAIPLAVGFILINALAFSPPTIATVLLNATGTIIPGVQNLWSFMWLLISIIVMWKGLKTALSIDTIFEGATSSITGFGDSIGTIIKNAPLNLPLIPAAGGSKTLGQAGSELSALAGASGRGDFLTRLKQGKVGGDDSGGGTTTVTINEDARTVLRATLASGMADNDVLTLARKLKELNPDASTDAIQEKLREEMIREDSSLANDTTKLNEKLELVRQKLESI